jgi:5-methylcytosine-specific restriction endonuclease McrA
MEKRKCKTCGVEKEFPENFRPHTVKGKVYYEYECRKCGNERAKQWHRDNAEYSNARNRAIYAANPEKNRAESLAYYHANKKVTLEKRARERAENGDRIRELDRAAAKRWRAAHPFEAKQWSAKQRAIKRNAKTEPISKKQIDNLLVKQRGRCAICGKKMKAWHVDHIVPLSKGGEHGIKNFQLTHPRCNMTKKAQHPIDYMQKLGFLL